MADKTPTAPPAGPLPDGSSESDYTGHNSWTMRRWAWEFLRRNDEFISECCRVADDDKASKAAIAAKYGLKKFQDYATPYNPDKPVRFTASYIVVHSNVDSDSSKTLPKHATRPLEKGEVLIRFDVSATTGDRDALKAQIRQAGQKLRQRRTEMLQGADDPKGPQKRTSHPDKYRHYLRALDLTRSGLSQSEALRLLNADHDLVSDPDVKNWLVRDNLKSQLIAARKLVSYKYRALAVSGKYKGAAKKKNKGEQGDA